MRVRIIASAVIEKDGKYLFGKKAPGVGPYPDKWLILGGGVNTDVETIEEALYREITEEGNIQINHLSRVWFGEDKREKNGETIHHFFLVFKADYLSGEAKPGDDIKELKWVEKTELPYLNVADVTTSVLQKLGLI